VDQADWVSGDIDMGRTAGFDLRQVAGPYPATRRPRWLAHRLAARR
jgi:hypothetical protein